MKKLNFLLSALIVEIYSYAHIIFFDQRCLKMLGVEFKGDCFMFYSLKKEQYFRRLPSLGCTVFFAIVIFQIFYDHKLNWLVNAFLHVGNPHLFYIFPIFLLQNSWSLNNIFYSGTLGFTDRQLGFLSLRYTDSQSWKLTTFMKPWTILSFIKPGFVQYWVSAF